MWLLDMQQLASCVCDWTTVLRAAASGFRFIRPPRMWDHGPLYYCEFYYYGQGSLARDIVLDGDEVRTVADRDV